MNVTLVKGLKLLELLALQERPLGVSEIARALGVAKSNAHRLLQTLVELGFVAQDAERGAYFPALRTLQLGSGAWLHENLRRLAQGPMQKLSTRTRETLQLSVLDGDEVVYLHKIESPEPVRTASRVGGRAPAHCAATGKAMLACLEDARVREVSQRLVAHSQRTLTDPDAFLAQIEAIRRQGYAVSEGEWHAAVNGVAAAIRDSRGRPIGAIGVSGPAERLTRPLFETIGEQVRDAVSRIPSIETERATV